MSPNRVEYFRVRQASLFRVPNEFLADNQSNPVVKTAGYTSRKIISPIASLRRYVAPVCLGGPSASLMRRSSTCKRLANICAPALFRTITNATKTQLDYPLIYLVKIGRFVEHVKLYMEEIDDGTPAMAVETCSNLRCITIDYSRKYTWNDHALLDAILLLPALTEFRLIGYPGHAPGVMGSEDIGDNILKPLLGRHGDKLRSLTVSGKGTLGFGGLASLIRDATRLVELELYSVLGAHLHRTLAQSSTWACAAHLQSLTFGGCGGLQANIFTQKLASGVFGHPQKVSLATCGKLSDKRPPGLIEWTIPALDTFKLSCSATREMEHLQLIHAKKVFLSRVRRHSPQGLYKMVIQQIAHERAFPEATEVHVTTDWSDEDFSELQRVCSARGIKIITRDLNWH